MLKRIVLFLCASFLMGSLAHAQSNDHWVTFKGTAKLSGESYTLVAADKNGSMQVPKAGVSVSGTEVKVKVGTIVKVIKKPKGKPAGDDAKPVDGCRQRQCVGLVLICCDDGRVLSACLGAFGCS
jgi:hypothetical protein